MSVMKQLGKQVGLDATQAVRDFAGGVPEQFFGADVPLEQRMNISGDLDQDLKKLSDVTGKDYEIIKGDISGTYLGKVELGGSMYGMVKRQDSETIGLTPWSEELTGQMGKDISITGKERTVEVMEKEENIMREVG